SGQGSAGQVSTSGEELMDTIAEEYVALVLALGLHDPGYVDAFYGPDAWKSAVDADPPSLADIAARSSALQRQLDEGTRPQGGMPALRHGYRQRQLVALSARVGMLQGNELRFDQESKALYDAVAPTLPESHFQAIVAQLDEALPG